jgi:hypothetical protein
MKPNFDLSRDPHMLLRRVSLLYLIVFAGTSMLACGSGGRGGSSSGSPALSQADANALATQITSTLGQGLSSSSGSVVRWSGKEATGPDYSSCSFSGSTVVCTFSGSTACPAGGE